MGPGAGWGSISNQAPSQRDGTWLVGRCHLIGDLRGSGHYPQSPEQGEWMSLLQTFPITIGLRVIKGSSVHWILIFSRLRRLTIVKHCWVRLMQPSLVLSWFLPTWDVAVHRHPRSPTSDGATRPAFVPPPPRLASWHSFLRARTIAVRTAVSRCPVRRLPTCIASSPPTIVVTSGLRPC
jgi:hypothetical protein